MAGKPWEKYQTAPAQPEAVPATPAGGKPWEKYAQPQAVAPAPAPEPAQPERMPIEGQFLGKFTEGIAGLPGVPLDLIAAGGNFARRQFDLPETQLKDTWAKDWGSEGWSDYVFNKLGGTKVDAPTNDTERVVQKGGLFFGGGVPFGPAGLLPTALALVGSEAGRKADEIAPEYTKGYGETVGTLAGGVAGSGRRAPLKTPAPTEADILAAKNAAYKTADNAGLIYTPGFTQRLEQTVSNDLAGAAFDEVMHPLVARVVKRINDRTPSNVTLADVDNLRQLAGNAAESMVPKERFLASKIIERIDEAIDNPQTGEVLMGDPAAGAAAIREARALNQRLMKLRRVNDALHNADVHAETTYSGGNIDNTIRQKLKPMLLRGKRASKENRGWTADERAMLRRVTKGGGVTHQIARLAGKMSPESGGLMQAMWGLLGTGSGIATGGGSLPMVAAAAGGTAVAKRIADAMTRGHAQELVDTIARGGKAFQPRSPKRMLTRAAAPIPGYLASERD